MTCTQPVRLFAERGLLTDSQVLIKAALSLLCHSVPCTGGRPDLWAYRARCEQPGVINQKQLKIFILNFEGAASPRCFLSQLGSIFSWGFCPRRILSGRLLANTAPLPVHCPPCRSAGCSREARGRQMGQKLRGFVHSYEGGGGRRALPCPPQELRCQGMAGT